MRAVALTLIVLLRGLAAAAPLDEAGQLVLVRAASWNARAGTLQRFVRRGKGWLAEGAPVPVSLGARGLAWGRGVAPATPEEAPAPGPAKVEGDSRTPAGVFRLTAATGAPAEPPSGTRLPYARATERLVCVDDGASRHYNTVTEAGGAGDDWKSFEAMLSPPVYEYTIFVDHNPQRTPGGGSCIFLHVARAPGATTLGCTAMARPELEALLAWLDPERRPLLVVLPEPAYRAVRKSWGLPTSR